MLLIRFGDTVLIRIERFWGESGGSGGGLGVALGEGLGGMSGRGAIRIKFVSDLYDFASKSMGSLIRCWDTFFDTLLGAATFGDTFSIHF